MKVPNSGADNMMPPMGSEPPMPMNDPNMPPMGGMGEEGQPIMDDMDVEDSEGGVGSDIKKYSGELSQALNTYNEENPEDEEKLNKYAINMIAAQVANSLSDKDKRQVIKKIKGDSEDDEIGIEGQEPNDDAQMMEQISNNVVNEITNELMDTERHGKRGEKYITNDEVTSHNPFVSNRK